jgi:streptogramin lyase
LRGLFAKYLIFLCGPENQLGGTMKSPLRAVGFVLLFGFLSGGATAGTISGRVKGSGGEQFKGAFVRAQNVASNISVNVLSNRQGEFQIENLAPGKYRVRATAAGYKSDADIDVTVEGMHPVSVDFTLYKGAVRWSDLSIYQGRVLLPDDPGKELLFDKCMSCHGYMLMMAGTHRDEDGWKAAVSLMRDVRNGVGDLRTTDQEAASIAQYLNNVFGIDSKLPLPTELPGYEKVKHGEFSDEAMKIVYVEYDMPGPRRFPWNANPDNKGNIWMPFAKTANRIAKLNVSSGEVQEWNVPPGAMRMLDVHSAVVGPDGLVWYVQVKGCKLGKFDPRTNEFKQYTPPFCNRPAGGASGGDALEDAGGEGGTGSSGITVRVDRLGYVWAGAPIMYRFDPRTEKFTTFPEVVHAYGINLDEEDNVWFANFSNTDLPTDGEIGKININTLKVSIYTPPTTARLAALNKNFPREIGNYVKHPKSAGTKRIEVDSNGIVWFGEWWGGKDGQHSQIGRFDPKTNVFKEFPLPDPAATPYAVGVDHNGFVWYNSSDDDIIGRLDPKTGVVVKYPFPHSDNGIRELNTDSDGRIWYTTPFNNKVGYFFPPK